MQEADFSAQRSSEETDFVINHNAIFGNFNVSRKTWKYATRMIRFRFYREIVK